MKEARAALAGFKHIFVAYVDGCTWEDNGPHEPTPHHLQATVVRSYKGDWKVSERLAFMLLLDEPAPTPGAPPRPLCKRRLIRVFTSKHTSAEIELHPGEFAEYDKSSTEARALECVYPRAARE